MSSITRTRSSIGTRPQNALSIVVLPDPVGPADDHVFLALEGVQHVEQHRLGQAPVAYEVAGGELPPTEAADRDGKLAA